MFTPPREANALALRYARTKIQASTLSQEALLDNLAVIAGAGVGRPRGGVGSAGSGNSLNSSLRRESEAFFNSCDQAMQSRAELSEEEFAGLKLQLHQEEAEASDFH